MMFIVSTIKNGGFKFTARPLLEHIKRYMKSSTIHKASFTPTYVWVFENCKENIGRPAIEKLHNLHVHWIMHVPEGYEDDVLNKILFYLKKRTLINERTVHLGDTQRNPKLSYFIKRCKPELIKLYGRGREASDQGEVLGERRIGYSRNICKSARKVMDKDLGIKRKHPKNYN